jgi:hypothetical protein
MAIRRAPQECSPCASHAFPAGNGEGLNLDFEGIVAGMRHGKTGKTAKKERIFEIAIFDRVNRIKNLRTHQICSYASK